jgi:uracil-DNA glycosylase family 4
MTQEQIINRRSDRFNIACRKCERLANFLDAVKAEFPDYYCKPVPPFGDPDAEILLIGLAPGKHGANASGRPFTGDHAGLLLYQTLHKFGLASQPTGAHADDGLLLNNIRIINAVKCLPPENKPTTQEVDTCREYLKNEFADKKVKTLIALGGIAHRAILKTQGLVLSSYPFAHLSDYNLPSGLRLISSYHCSRYNTQTKRLTPEMFEAVFKLAMK